MNIFRKIFPVLAALAIIVSLMPAGALTEESEPVTETISVSVTAKGSQPATPETYTIRLTPEGDFPMPGNKTGGSADLKITGPKSGTFPEITFDNVGMYSYTIRMIAGTKSGVKYDSTVYNLKITVHREEEGLMVTCALRKQGKTEKLDKCSFEVTYPTTSGGGGTPFTPDDDLGMGMLINVGDCLE